MNAPPGRRSMPAAAERRDQHGHDRRDGPFSGAAPAPIAIAIDSGVRDRNRLEPASASRPKAARMAPAMRRRVRRERTKSR
jgi:hypothetical protein